jgi:organic radical activating enzyme
MEKYLEYKQWWCDWCTSASFEDQFEEHINSMTTYELMETLANWGE